MTFLTKEQILARRALPVEDVEVKEWDGTVRVQGLSAGDADAFSASLIREANGKPQLDRLYYCAKLLARCLVNESGACLLSEGDVLVLSQQSAIPIYRLTAIAERLSGLQAQGVEAAAKN